MIVFLGVLSLKKYHYLTNMVISKMFFLYHRSTQSRFDVNPNASFQSKQIDFASKSGT
jgi:hypothetical protein